MPDLFFGEFSTDTLAPEVTDALPQGLAISEGADVTFTITDEDNGVDFEETIVYIGGTLAYDWDGVGGDPNTGFQNGFTGSVVDVGGGAYDVTLTPPADFASNATINVTIDSQDLGDFPNVMAQYTWSFDVRDYESPFMESNSPTGVNVPLDTLIQVRLRDLGTGVDITTVIIKVDSVEAYNWDGTGGDPDLGFQTGFQGVNSEVTGAPDDYLIIIHPESDLGEYTTYQVDVEAKDLA